jgi:hypothetical protein
MNKNILLVLLFTLLFSLVGLAFPIALDYNTISIFTSNENFTSITAGAIGASAPVMNFDFTDIDSDTNYIVDNSIVPNYGANYGATHNQSCSSPDNLDCLDFDGNNNYITVSPARDFNFTAPYSIDFWANQTSVTTNTYSDNFNDNVKTNWTTPYYMFYGETYPSTQDLATYWTETGGALKSTQPNSNFGMAYHNGRKYLPKKITASFKLDNSSSAGSVVFGHGGHNTAKPYYRIYYGYDWFNLHALNGAYASGTLTYATTKNYVWHTIEINIEINGDFNILFDGAKRLEGQLDISDVFGHVGFYSENTMYYDNFYIESHNGVLLNNGCGDAIILDDENAIIQHSGQQISGNYSLAQDNHFTLANDGTNQSLYLNGSLLDSQNAGDNNASCEDNWHVGNDFNGTLYNLRMWDYNLSQKEISSISSNDNQNVGKYFSDANFESKVIHNLDANRMQLNVFLADVNRNNCSVNDVTCGDGINTNYSNLTAYWPLDQNSEDVTGTYTSTTTGTREVNGLSSKAKYFDGIDDQIVNGGFSRDNYCGNTQSESVSLWFYNEDNTRVETPRLFSIMWEDSGNPQLQLHAKTGVGCYGTFGAGSVGAPSYTIEKDKWYQVACVFEADGCTTISASLYVNGQKIGTNNYSSGPYLYGADADRIKIGSQKSTYDRFFHGSIDEVAYFRNHALTDEEVGDLYKAGLSQHVDADVLIQTRTATDYNLDDSGLVGLWALNGNTNDATGNNHGANQGATFSEEAGVVGQGASFNGSSDYISTNQSLVEDNYTLSLWMQPNITINSSNSLDYGLIGYDVHGVTNGHFGLGWNINNVGVPEDGTLKFNTQNGAGTFFSGNKTTWNALQWYHVAVVVENNSTGTIYVNGEIDGSGAVNGGIMLPWIGANVKYGGTKEYFDGKIDEVKLYTRALAQEEIQNLYGLGSHHIEWSNWRSATQTDNNQAHLTAGDVNFLQYRTIIDNSTTNVSAFVLGHQVSLVNSLSYKLSGEFISKKIDLGIAKDFNVINYTSTEPSGTEIIFKIRSAQNEIDLNTAAWHGPTTTDDNYSISGQTINSVHDGNSWVQWKAILTTNNSSTTPTLTDINIQTKNKVDSNAIFVVGDGSTHTWDTVTTTEVTPGDTSVSWFYSTTSPYTWQALSGAISQNSAYLYLRALMTTDENNNSAQISEIEVVYN